MQKITASLRNKLILVSTLVLGHKELRFLARKARGAFLGYAVDIPAKDVLDFPVAVVFVCEGPNLARLALLWVKGKRLSLLVEILCQSPGGIEADGSDLVGSFLQAVC